MASRWAKMPGAKTFKSVGPTGKPSMDESKLLSSLGQVCGEKQGVVFGEYLRGCVRQMLSDVMAAEVTESRGAKHRPNGSEHFRSGSSPGRVLHEGQREDVLRPRVRRHLSDGSSEEVTLASYESANNPDELRDSIVNALVAGVSTRDVRQDLDPKSPGFVPLERFPSVAGRRAQVRRCSSR